MNMRNHILFRLTLLTFLVTLPTSPANAESKTKRKNPFPGSTEYVYKTINKTKLHLYAHLPKDHSSKDKRPAIVFFFGGGWNGGTPKQFTPHAKYLASRGMVAFTAEYRVKRTHGTTPFHCVSDGKSAIRWVRENAAKLGIDPKRIVASGGSAGGHVAACTALIKDYDEKTENRKISSVPNALVLFNPVIDTSKKGFGYNRFKQKYKLLSPVHHVRPNLPPTILFHGNADTTVPHANAVDFKTKMLAAKNRCELHTYPKQKHGFFNHGRNKNIPYIDTVKKMDLFLISLKYLTGKPTIKSPQTYLGFPSRNPPPHARLHPFASSLALLAFATGNLLTTR